MNEKNGERAVPGPYEDTTCQIVLSYGNPYHPQLETIREFRDKKLKTNPLGKKLVNLYYNISSVSCAVTSRSRILRELAFYTFAYPAYRISKFFLER